ncbi:MAG TPA: penicillin acylase family protein [Flavisolibacter sp.]|nr:penicillin acylase family protein [Flavisolibacter sp.]
MRCLIFLFPLLFLFLFPSFSQSFTPAEVARFKTRAANVTIIRDQWGIPHVYGKKDADAVFGLLYAQCEENFAKVERNYLQMLGRLSEVEGKSLLYQDLQMQLIYDSAEAKRDYKKSPAWFRALLDAFADGINYYIYTHKELKPSVLKRFEPWFALMYTDGSISATQLGGLTVQDTKNLYTLSDNTTSFIERPAGSRDSEPSGSNGFALAPSRTESGNAMLYINPHVTFYFRSEMHMVSEEGLNAYGAVTWGQFFVYQGFNEHCGWMHTTSYADVADLFEESIEKKADSVFYRFDGKRLPVKTRRIELRFREGEQTPVQSFLTYATGHGPIMGSRNGRWLSLKENNRSLDALMQSWLRTKANGFEAFRKVMNLRANNSNNTVFADDKGNIAYWHGNFMPRRDTGFYYGLPVDGSTAASDWKGLHALDELVHVYNPASGWIQNCNSTPFTAAGESSPRRGQYPVYMAPDGQNFRALNAMRLLEGKSKFTMDKLISEVGYSRYLAAFDELLPRLLRAYGALAASDSLSAALAEPIRLLRAWDKHSAEASIATTIAIEWAYRLLQNLLPPSDPYQLSDATGQMRSFLDGLPSLRLLTALRETMADLDRRFGRWQIAWGDVNRYQRVKSSEFSDSLPSVPVGLAASNLGSLPSYFSRRYPNTDKRYGSAGNSFVACVEFGKKLKARSVTTGGQSFDPNSANYTDQAQRFLEGNFKEVLFYKEDVEKHAVRRYHPGE